MTSPRCNCGGGAFVGSDEDDDFHTVPSPPGGILESATLAPGAEAHMDWDDKAPEGSVPGDRRTSALPLERSTVHAEQVDSLARAASSASTPPDDSGDRVAAAPNAPNVAGYDLSERLGAGTFGEVWSAVQLNTGQHVALKILYQGSASELTAMQLEVTRLASVAEHPHVVTVLDANFKSTPAYLVTPLLAGGSLEGQKDASSTQIAFWLEQLAIALGYVHGKGLIHCDLKLANVLLDEEGSVRIVDWGQARSAGRKAISLGTIWYMPPEQAVLPREGFQVVPDVSWDIYALGATVYHLLTHGLPRASESGHRSIHQDQQTSRVLERYREVLERSPLTPIRTLNKSVDEDLACIVEHCLELDPTRRYANMSEIAEDLRRRRARLPLLCRPRNLLYTTRLFLARNRVNVLLSAIFVTLLTISGALSVRRVVRAEAIAVRNLALFEHQNGLRLWVADRDVSALWLARANVHHPSTEYAKSAAWANANLPPIHAILKHGSPRTNAEPFPGIQNIDFADNDNLVLTSGFDNRARLTDVTTGAAVGAPMTHGDTVVSAVFSPDRQRIATASLDGTARVWDLSGMPLTPPLQQNAPVTQVLWSPDGKSVLTLGGGYVGCWNATTGEATQTFRTPAPATSMAFSHHGNLFAIGMLDGTITTWNFQDGKAGPGTKAPEGIHFLSWSPDDQILGFGTYSSVVHLRRIGSDLDLASEHLNTSQALPVLLDFLPDGRAICVCGNGMFRLFEATGGNSVESSLKITVSNAFLSHDGSMLCCLSRDGSAHLLDPLTHQSLIPALQGSASFTSGSFSPDDKFLALASDDGQIRIYRHEDITNPARFSFHNHLARSALNEFTTTRSPLSPFAILHDSWIAMASRNEVDVVKSARGERPFPPLKIRGNIIGISANTDGTRLAVFSKTNAYVFDAATGDRIARRRTPGPIVCPTRDRVALTSENGPIVIWKLDDLTPVENPIPLPTAIRRIFLSPDGRFIGVCLMSQQSVVLRTDDGQPVIRAFDLPIFRMTFSPDGNTLLVVSLDPQRHAQLWDLKTGKALTAPFSGQTSVAAFSPDGKRVAIACSEDARVYDAHDGTELGRLPHEDHVSSVCFSDDGKLILTGSADKTVRIWDATTCLALSPPLTGTSRMLAATMTADRREVVALDPTAQFIWPTYLDTQDPSPSRLLLQSEVLTGMSFDDEGNLHPLTPSEFLDLRKAAGMDARTPTP